MGRAMFTFKRLQATAAMLAFGAAAMVDTAHALSTPTYDGTWSVVIITNFGSCDRAYRYPVRINNGAVLNDGPSVATVSGKVASNGSVSVVVSGAGKVAQ